MFLIAALYKFADFPEFSDFQKPLHRVCADNDVLGTILLASEGLNGTIAGPPSGVENVLAFIRSEPRFATIEAKLSHAEDAPFLRLKIRLKQEIVALGVGDIDSINGTGTYVAPSEWNDLISDPDVVVIDTRNDYEFAIGTFEGAVNPEIDVFRDFPSWVANRTDLADKPPVAMFCTGGIRCEKLTAWMKNQGFDNVYQLEGGILKYLETVPEDESTWDGECYVFDRRVSVGHGLIPGDNDQCPNCNTVVTPQDRTDPRYAVGVTCPACFDVTSDSRKSRFAERQKQIELAAARGESHLAHTHSRSDGAGTELRE
ncbi:Rhodanese domain protein UPF0176, cyanobacterial/alphaproteobacterial subgroup [hydrothermal vent metagenome]|uniref:Rhodanese domain protein UPF0176, cyanobacterial/alphaproteobacterial subgroup n=1 Tax=hydrothermal vent metagenome TaxID=652676 RepID=A0A3B0SJV2_9ZZZZ